MQDWVSDSPVVVRELGHNMVDVPNHHMLAHDRAIQGAFSGSQTMFVECLAPEHLESCGVWGFLRELKREEGWSRVPIHASSSGFWACVAATSSCHVRPNTFHLRLVCDGAHDIPQCEPTWWEMCLVVEVSFDVGHDYLSSGLVPW